MLFRVLDLGGFRCVRNYPRVCGNNLQICVISHIVITNVFQFLRDRPECVWEFHYDNALCIFNTIAQ